MPVFVQYMPKLFNICQLLQPGPSRASQDPGLGRTRPLNTIDQRQAEQVRVNGHGWTAGLARPLECSRRVGGGIGLGCGAVRQSGRPKLGSTGQNHVSHGSDVRAEGRLRAGSLGQGRDDSWPKGQTRNSNFPAGVLLEALIQQRNSKGAGCSS